MQRRSHCCGSGDDYWTKGSDGVRCCCHRRLFCGEQSVCWRHRRRQQWCHQSRQCHKWRASQQTRPSGALWPRVCAESLFRRERREESVSDRRGKENQCPHCPAPAAAGARPVHHWARAAPPRSAPASRCVSVRSNDSACFFMLLLYVILVGMVVV